MCIYFRIGKNHRPTEMPGTGTLTNSAMHTRLAKWSIHAKLDRRIHVQIWKYACRLAAKATGASVWLIFYRAFAHRTWIWMCSWIEVTERYKTQEYRCPMPDARSNTLYIRAIVSFSFYIHRRPLSDLSSTPACFLHLAFLDGIVQIFRFFSFFFSFLHMRASRVLCVLSACNSYVTRTEYDINECTQSTRPWISFKFIYPIFIVHICFEFCSASPPLIAADSCRIFRPSNNWRFSCFRMRFMFITQFTSWTRARSCLGAGSEVYACKDDERILHDSKM